MRKAITALVLMLSGSVVYAEGSILDQLYMGFVGHAKFAWESNTDGQNRPGFHLNYVEIGKLNGDHLGALDVAADGEILEDQFDAVKWSVGGKLHLSPLIKNFVNLPEAWVFLNTLEIDARASYDFTDEKERYGLVAAYPFR